MTRGMMSRGQGTHQLIIHVSLATCINKRTMNLSELQFPSHEGAEDLAVWYSIQEILLS